MAVGFQTVLHLIYPPRCTVCSVNVDSDFGLCGACWRDTPFISGLCCDLCGVPLPGQETGAAEICDDCLRTDRPWSRGRAALVYRDNARKLVLALKHGDRQDVVRPASVWMAQAAKPLLCDGMLIAPIPLHWMRLLKRRYNQSALLAKGIAAETGLSHCPDLLIRPRHTQSLGGLDHDARFSTLSNAIDVHPKRRHRLAGRPVLLIDDVMTSGATLAAATEACLSSGAKDVCTLTLARAARDA
ncbi:MULTISPECIES: ComF family protein [unclassified Roseovarius]|uniref:ComF family protein n=1 Tax=unclassified Roseovarius TaxID=2614913 RepID=UPI00273E4417|nr:MULTISPECIES: ComF family protein [unclassified Roseovarius]